MRFYHCLNVHFFKRSVLGTVILLMGIFLSTTNTYGQNTDLKALEAGLNAMLATKKPDTLKSFLSSKFSVGPYTQPSAVSCLNYIAQRLDYEKIVIKEQKKSSSGEILSVTFKKNGKDQQTGWIQLDDSGKIKFVDVFDKLYGMDRNAHSKLVAEVPFETTAQGAVVLEVKLNNSDRILKLLFDTGADGMALPERLADSLGLKRGEKRSTSVVGGNVDIEISSDNTVHIGALSLPHQSIAIFKQMDRYDGIIGNTILRSYITAVNYDKQTISFYNFGDFDLNSHGGQNGHEVDASLPSGVVIVPGNLSVNEGKSYNGKFVFDLGAAYSLICFRPFVRHNRLLVDGFVPAYSGSTTSLGRTTPTFTGPAESFQFGSLPKIDGLSVTLMSGGGQSESWDPGFDGSIGTRLISKYNFIIDLQAQKILFTPNKSYHNPQDFVHAGMLFGFAPDGALQFLGYVGSAGPKDGLERGTRILKIDCIESDILRGNKAKLQSLLKKDEKEKWNIIYDMAGQQKAMEI